jgi:Protein of unknown function (DUF2726)
MIAIDPDPTAIAAIAAAVLALLTLLMLRLRGPSPRKRAKRDVLDTVAAWQPDLARVMSVAERRAYEVLRQALPGHLVLAQVPLSRFLRVPTRNSYSDWLQRVGCVSADLLLCDTGSRVLAVVDMRSANESERGRKRHERMGRVLKAAGVTVLVWREDQLPSVAEVRNLMIPVLERNRPAQAMQPTSSRPLPLIPVAEMEELLAHGDAALGQDAAMEPVPSTLFDELAEPLAVNARR